MPLGRNIVLFVGVALAVIGCGHKAPSQTRVAQMNVQLTRDDLEGIRKSVIAYFESGKDEYRTVFIAELKRGAIFQDNPDSPRIGIWRIRRHGDKVDLVRQPPASREMHLIGVHLLKERGVWKVTGDFEERETLDIPG